MAAISMMVVLPNHIRKFIRATRVRAPRVDSAELLSADLPKYAWNTFVMWILGFVPQIIVALILAC